jgi:hypothetical protein
MTTARGRPTHLRLVTGGPHTEKPDVLTRANRDGEPYYLHEGRTKTGKARYFVARTVGPDALGAMPAGFEIAESVNGVVSVRRVDPTRPQVAAADLLAVRAEVARHGHLRRYVVDARDGEIFVREPECGCDEEGLRGMAAELGVSMERMREASVRRRPRHRPVMKFGPATGDEGDWVACRMVYRGFERWHLLSVGPLAYLARRYVGHVGRETFFELM